MEGHSWAEDRRKKMKNDIVKGEVTMSTHSGKPFFGVFVGQTIYNVDIKAKTCTFRGYDLSDILGEHACAIILSLHQNVVDSVDDMFKYPIQQLVYSGVFHGIERDTTCQKSMMMVLCEMC